MRRLAPAIISLLLIIGCIIYLYLNPKEPVAQVSRSSVYIASENQTAAVYFEEDHFLYEYEHLPRGTRVISRGIDVPVNNGEYVFSEIELDGENDENGDPVVFYILPQYLTSDPNAVVSEPVRYVRTSSTVYKDPDSGEIVSFVRKGTQVNVCGFAGLNKDGSVDMYQIDHNGQKGYVYSKYLVGTQEEADSVYSSVYGNHAGRSFSENLQGGGPESLDWYPFYRVELKSGPLLEDARAMYLNADALNALSIEEYITLALESGVNAVVVDVKDASLLYESEVAKRLCPSGFESAVMTASEYKESIEKLRDAGFYLIGRICVFQDEAYAADHPEDAIMAGGENTMYPSPYSRNCWYYNISLAKEAVEEFGFREIQFDEVRFPENARELSEAPDTDFRNSYHEEKAEAIQNFCFYAADQLHKAEAYVSVAVSADCAEEYVAASGQYWPAISNIVDVISGKPFTDLEGPETDTWTFPYTTVYEWAVKAVMRQTEIRTPAIARTYITGYDAPSWNPYINYGATQLTEQAQALYDSGLTGGFIPWNQTSSLNKYYTFNTVWNDQYHN